MEIPVTFYLEDPKTPTYKKKLSVEPQTTLAEILTRVKDTEIQVKILPEERLWFRSPSDREYLLDRSTPVEKIPFWERSGVDLCLLGQEEIEKFIDSAVSQSKLDQIKALIELGYISANYELPKTDRFPRRSLLFMAAASSRPDIVAYLLSQGADVQAKNDLGDNALHAVVKFLRKEALTEEAIECARLLIEHGIDVNAKGEYDNTAAHWLCARGGILAKRVLPLLLQKGADLSLENDEGLTARDYAEKYHNPECIRLLDEHAPLPPAPKEVLVGEERQKHLEELVRLLLLQVLPQADPKAREELLEAARKLGFAVE